MECPMKGLSLDHRLLENFSWPLLFSMLILCLCGLVNLYSVSLSYQFSDWSWFFRQSAFFGVALVGMLVIILIDYQYLKRLIWPIYLIGIISLVAVLTMGTHINGATRWLDLGFMRFQPSESVKVIVVVALAAWFAKRDLSQGLGFKELVVPLIIIAIPLGLIHKQPDLGTTLHILATCFPMFLIFRFRPHLIVSVLMIGLLTIGLAASIFASGSWQILLDKGIIKPYQVERIETMFDPEKDPSRNGWQTLQSRNAVGGGQLFGRGFMQGPQHLNGFLPEAETDFAFAALAEEWGFVGSLVVLAMFLCLMTSGLLVARRSKDRFGSMIVLGLTSLLFWQVVINIGMVIGLLPVVGIPLPFISYGGTSLVVTIAAVGLMLNVGMRRYMFQDEAVRENPNVWRQEPEEEHQGLPTAPVRRLSEDTPFNPELHPRHRLPHVRPWAKYLHRSRIRHLD
ncbi:rod shape-determining protein RodA [Deltaproteobacteria bacterium Smac51]|nr:rod shape-determining protein RodA [Deltaproteobacteria bacterium Smac51]